MSCLVDQTLKISNLLEDIRKVEQFAQDIDNQAGENLTEMLTRVVLKKSKKVGSRKVIIPFVTLLCNHLIIRMLGFCSILMLLALVEPEVRG